MAKVIEIEIMALRKALNDLEGRVKKSEPVEKAPSKHRQTKDRNLAEMEANFLKYRRRK